MWPFSKRSRQTTSPSSGARAARAAAKRDASKLETPGRGRDGTILGDLIRKGLYSPKAGSEVLGHFDPNAAPFRTFPNGKTGLIQGPMADMLIQSIPASRSVFGSMLDDNKDLAVALALKLGCQSTRAVLDGFQALVKKDATAEYLMVTTSMPFFLTYSTNKVVVVAEVDHELKLNALANLLLNDAAFSSVHSLADLERKAQSLVADRKEEVEDRKQWAIAQQGRTQP